MERCLSPPIVQEQSGSGTLRPDPASVFLSLRITDVNFLSFSNQVHCDIFLKDCTINICIAQDVRVLCSYTPADWSFKVWEIRDEDQGRKSLKMLNRIGDLSEPGCNYTVIYIFI